MGGILEIRCACGYRTAIGTGSVMNDVREKPTGAVHPDWKSVPTGVSGQVFDTQLPLQRDGDKYKCPACGSTELTVRDTGIWTD